MVSQWPQWILLLSCTSATILGLKCGEDKAVVCYLVSWSLYRTGEGLYEPSQVDPHLCTHLVYGYFGIDSTSSLLISRDPWADFTPGKGTIEKLVELKSVNPKLKVMVSVGGWNEGSTNFSTMAGSSERKSVFINSVMTFLSNYSLDGLDVNWEFPARRGGKVEDKENFVSLLKDLSTRFKEKDYVLSVQLSAKMYVIEDSYDVRGISEVAHLLALTTFKFNGPWNGQVGFNAPLKDSTVFNVEAAVKEMLSRGARKEILLVGLPTYGNSFILEQAAGSSSRVKAANATAGPPFPYTAEQGYIGYNEACWILGHEKGWQTVWDQESSTPYAVKGRRVITYDNKDSFNAKLDLVAELDLGGAMLYTLDTDDFGGRCGERYPLLGTAARRLCRRANVLNATVFSHVVSSV